MSFITTGVPSTVIGLEPEFGTWTPTLRTKNDPTEATITVFNSNYMKMGQYVVAWLDMVVTSPPATGDQHLEVHGLPFPSYPADPTVFYTASAGYQKFFNMTGELVGILFGGNQFIRYFIQENGVQTRAEISAIGTNARLMTTMIYLTNP